MNPDQRHLKQALRDSIRSLAGEVSPETRRLDSARLCLRLREQPLWRESRSVAAFFPMPDETDLRPLLGEALSAGKILALPRFNAARRDYELVQVENLSDLQPGHYGILEPKADAAPLKLKLLDLILVPGVAYDLKGRRLGRGRGYYDRLLTHVQGCKCGVAFDWQLMEEVPAESHDVCVNWILTPSRWIECAG